MVKMCSWGYYIYKAIPYLRSDMAIDETMASFAHRARTIIPVKDETGLFKHLSNTTIYYYCVD